MSENANTDTNINTDSDASAVRSESPAILESSPPVENVPLKKPLRAGFWTRFLAHWIDSLILTLISFILEAIVMGLVFIPAYFVAKAHSEAPPAFMDVIDPFWLQILNAGLYFVAAFPYFVLGHFKYGTTIGKMPFKIYVRNAKTFGPITLKESVIRFVAYLASYLPMGCGFLMAAFHPEKRALHDIIAGTASVYEKPELKKPGSQSSTV